MGSMTLNFAFGMAFLCTTAETQDVLAATSAYCTELLFLFWQLTAETVEFMTSHRH